MDTFFTLSKLAWQLVMPSNLLVLLLLVGFALHRINRTARLGRRVGHAAAIALMAVSLLPIGDLMLRPLEQRFSPLASCAPPSHIAGILLLGGSVAPVTVDGRPDLELNEAADRVRFAASLARRFPEATVAVSGGLVFPQPHITSEAEVTASFLTELGVRPDRIILETRSRTTSESAAFATGQLNNVDGRWLVVTSAFHMPRAIGALRAAGVDVIAAPTDWRVPSRSPLLYFSVSARLRKFDLAVKEYLGLFGYWATGRSETLFPRPRDTDLCR